MNKSFLLLMILLISSGLCAQEEVKADPAGHWLDGVTIPPKPSFPTPQYDLQVSLSDGNPVPATLSEDVGIVFTVNSEIFGENPPSTFDGSPLPSAEWAGKTSVKWYFEDITKNKSTPASSEYALQPNQMLIKPKDPTFQGAVSVFLSRPLRYEEYPGKFRRIFATAAKSSLTKITDITPPCPGMEITLEGAKEGRLWSAEEPPDKFPLPKTVDMFFSGSIFSEKEPETVKTISGLQLGEKMIIPEAEIVVNIKMENLITLKPVVSDNQQINEKTLKCGLCSLDSGEPSIVLENLPEKFPAEKVLAIKKPAFFVEVADVSGNKSSLYVAIRVTPPAK
ncbi:MAG: hypothetical protein HQM10_00780 [Candidatus Riflebacteria bacterium]|nr:hypothetical protein [Candidatus Riflebacteria bacterium]